MFTIKHVESNGHESIRQVAWVSYDPGVGKSSSGERCLQCGPDDCFANGVVYVMNDNGKTVAKYDLDYPARN